MSVLIKGMKMPKSCESCPCKTADAFGGIGCQATGYIPIRKVNQDRPDDCPLSEVPPHGRLIDADVMAEDLYIDIENDLKALDQMELVGKARARIEFDKDCKQNYMLYLSEAPTVIEAEEG